MIWVIDNFDSFTYNLVQLLRRSGTEVVVTYNDQWLEPTEDLQSIQGIVLSPGPCGPLESGICPEVVRQLHTKIPILGVCLGHQVIGSVFGAEVTRGAEPVHGKTDTVSHTGDALFEGIPTHFTATRYHSLIVNPNEAFPKLAVTAVSETDQTVMAIRHRDYPVFGVQFHPESYASECGTELIQNFLKLCTKDIPLKEVAPCLINVSNP